MASSNIVVEVKLTADTLKAIIDLARPELSPCTERGMRGETIESRLKTARWEGRQEMRVRLMDVLFPEDDNAPPTIIAEVSE